MLSEKQFISDGVKLVVMEIAYPLRLLKIRRWMEKDKDALISE